MGRSIYTNPADERKYYAVGVATHSVPYGIRKQVAQWLTDNAPVMSDAMATVKFRVYASWHNRYWQGECVVFKDPYAPNYELKLSPKGYAYATKTLEGVSLASYNQDIEKSRVLLCKRLGLKALKHPPKTRRVKGQLVLDGLVFEWVDGEATYEFSSKVYKLLSNQNDADNFDKGSSYHKVEFDFNEYYRANAPKLKKGDVVALGAQGYTYYERQADIKDACGNTVRGTKYQLAGFTASNVTLNHSQPYAAGQKYAYCMIATHSLKYAQVAFGELKNVKHELSGPLFAYVFYDKLANPVAVLPAVQVPLVEV